jgi:hypothetical protein
MKLTCLSTAIALLLPLSTGFAEPPPADALPRDDGYGACPLSWTAPRRNRKQHGDALFLHGAGLARTVAELQKTYQLGSIAGTG